MDGTTGGRCQASYALRQYTCKGKIHKMIIQPAMLHGMETVPVREAQLVQW